VTTGRGGAEQDGLLMMRFAGKIRSDGEYADGADRQFITINKRYAAGFPYREGERVSIELEIGGRWYQAGVRTTPRQPIVYIAHDLRSTTGEEVRSVEVLQSAGYARNDEVVLDVDGSTVRVLRVQESSIQRQTEANSSRDRMLGGRYRLGRMIGRGGMGAVFAGMDERLERSVAIKLVSVADAGEEQQRVLRARFHREARSAARISHPNVVTVYDFGTDEASGLEYLVMELLEGEDLAAWMLRPGASLEERLEILHDAARGVGAGHRAGLIHRDIKPANLYISHDAGGVRVRVLDFGIATISNPYATATQLTVLGIAPLTPAYAAPEQFRGGSNPSPVSDVFSLGRIGFELLTGRRPYAGIDWTQTDAHAQPPVPLVRTLNASVRGHVATAIERALAYRPEDRHPNADAFAADLRGSDREATQEMHASSTRTAPAPQPRATGLDEHSRTERVPLRYATPQGYGARRPGAAELRGKVLRIAPEVLRAGNPRRPLTHGWLAFEVLRRAEGGVLPFEEYRERLFNPSSEIQELARRIPGVPNAYQDLLHIRHDIGRGRVFAE
jgi:hypothetical protein